MVDDKSDAELLREFRRGNTDAFAEFVGRHQDAIYRLALRNLHDPEAAREAAQEVFIRAWQKLGRWQFGQGKPFTWLYRTLTNVCREFRKKTNQQQAYHYHSADSLLFMKNNAKAEKDHLERLHLAQLIDDLPGRQREIIVLHIYEHTDKGKKHSLAGSNRMDPVGHNLSDIRRVCRTKATTRQ